MLFVHELHRVAGTHEHEFEAAYREGWMPTLAADADSRLLYFLHHAHGTGRAYQVVTVTALHDGAAYARLVERVQQGDLRRWAADVDRLRHGVTAKLLVTVPWAPPIVNDGDLTAVPADGREHELTVFMEDTAWPHEGMLDDYLTAARDHYAPSLAEGRHGGRSMLELQSVFQNAWGGGRRREVILWQKVLDNAGISRLVGTEIPAEHRAPGTWMNDALQVRDDWESRLLRTVAWSPLF
jgi:hypothetical protein